MVNDLIKPMKERVRFLVEHRNLFHSTTDTCIHPSNDNLQSSFEQLNSNRVGAQSNVGFSNDCEEIDPVVDCSKNNDMIDENNIDDEQPSFPNIYVIPDLPNKIQQIVAKDEINEFRSHTNARRLLLDTIFNDVTTKYFTLYPNRDHYKAMGKAILKLLNIPKTNEALGEWIESLKNKFKQERRPLQQVSSEVQNMKIKYGHSLGRPVKRDNNVIAPRRISSAEFWNRIDVDDGNADSSADIEFMKNILVNPNMDLDEAKIPWKKILVQRRTFIRDHTTKEVLAEFPGYRYASLIFDEIQYVCNVDIEQNCEAMLPNLLDLVPDNIGFVNDLPPVRLIKILSKHFRDSWQQILSSKEPLSPRPYIQITADKFIMLLDYEVVTETSSINQAVCILIALYGILLQEPGSLSKPLRLLLNQWNFVIEKRRKRDSHLLGASANEEIMRKTAENFAQDDDGQAAHLRDGEKQGGDQLGAGNSQSLITVSVQMDEADLMKEYPSDSSPSSPTDSSFVICQSSTNEQQITTSYPSTDCPHSNDVLPTAEKQLTRSALPLLKERATCNTNTKRRTSSNSTNRSSSSSKKNTSAVHKRPASPDKSIASRLKRSRVKRVS
ncbi:unnamed protein product [Adineta ricciae]|nr:unnamed protein product [Adineta ricciae]